MNVLVTGGAGFIGRWVVKELLSRRHAVWALDDMSNGRAENLDEFQRRKNFKGLIQGDIADPKIYPRLARLKVQACFHLAAKVIVQESIDNPADGFRNDVQGVFYLFEFLRTQGIKLVFVSSCMVYDMGTAKTGIHEQHAVNPASPYAAFKLAGEHMALSYYHAYQLPVTILRPFNTYGPFQKSTGEGGVVSIFLKKALEGKPLGIYGSGRQTRDFLYVEDCARFICQAGFSSKAMGQHINAGTGHDISVNHLAALIEKKRNMIQHLPHIHPQSEIMKLCCDARKAKRLLSWTPRVSLNEGLRRTRVWLEKECDVTSFE